MSRPVRVALSGASGTGKTTLARALAEALGVPMCPVGARSVAAEMGFASPYDVDAAGRRAEFQARLQDAKIAWEAEHDSFVTDRSSLDDLAYAALHGARELTRKRLERGLAHARERYTLWVFCPTALFHDTAGDAARVAIAGSAYHHLTECIISMLAVRAFGRFADNVLCLGSADLESRVAQVLREVSRG